MLGIVVWLVLNCFDLICSILCGCLVLVDLFLVECGVCLQLIVCWVYLWGCFDVVICC